MTEFPLVSIVTPSHNSVQTIAATIESVATQDYPNIEHWVIDGASSDGTQDILRGFPHLKWISEPDSGQSNALNKGFALASGSILGWLNADDLYQPGAIQRVVDHFACAPECDFVYGECHRISAEGEDRGYLPCEPYTWAGLLERYIIPQPAAFFRRAVYELAGGVDESLHYVMDYEWWLRIASCGFRMCRIDETLASFRLTAGSKSTSAPLAFWVEQVPMLERYRAEDMQLTAAEKQRIASRVAYRAGMAYLRDRHYTEAEAFLDSAFSWLELPYPSDTMLAMLADVLLANREEGPSCLDAPSVAVMRRSVGSSRHKAFWTRDACQMLAYVAAHLDDHRAVREHGLRAVLNSSRARRNLGFWKTLLASQVALLNPSCARKREISVG